MIDFDFGPIAILIPIGVVIIAPFIYSLFVDNYDKKSPPIDFLKAVYEKRRRKS